MSFRLTQQDFTRLFNHARATFTGAQMAWCLWETDPGVYKKLLPSSLVPLDRPLVAAFIASYPETNFSMPYKEAALFLVVTLKDGTPGLHTLAMPVTDDNALITGIVMGGYPKKMAAIEFHATGTAVAGHVERYRTRFFSLVLDLAAPPDDPGCEAISTGYITPKGVFVFNLMTIPAPSADLGAVKAYLYKQRIKTRPTRTRFCRARVELQASKYDPWAELRPVKMLGGWLFEGELVMQDLILVEEQPLADYVYLSFKGMEFVRFA